MKVGIFGGSFSPPHLGHRRLAEEFVRQAGLDKLIIVPAGNPPHKTIDGGAAGNDRCDMCVSAFADMPCETTVSRYELDRPGKGYTVDTLAHFAGEGELFLLCGSDMFLTLEQWRDPAGIFARATVVCGSREDGEGDIDDLTAAAERYTENYGARCLLMRTVPKEISSTDVRRALAASEKPDGISDGVFSVIKARSLYGFSPDVYGLRESVSRRMKPSRFSHTLGVEREAAALAKIYMPEREHDLRIAALLHDITKNETNEKQLQYCEEFGIIIGDFEKAAPKLLHAITGAAVAARDYTAYVTPEIIGAIRWHTTGRRGMTLFETLVYLADYIEDTRMFDECVALREYFHGASPETMSEKDARVHLYKTVIKSVEATVEGLTREGLPVDTNTTEYGEYTKALLTSGQET